MFFESLFTTITKELPIVSGKVFVITGTTTGTGHISAQVVAEHGGEVVLLNRASSRAESSLAKLKEAVPGATFVPIACDLQDFDSVRAACKELKEKYDAIYCLSNNAGIMMTPDAATKDGYDTQMQTNHLSHFLLTSELFPLLTAGAKAHGESRVVQHSSKIRADTPNSALEEKYLKANGGNLGGDGDNLLDFTGPSANRYAQTKLANAVFMYVLHDKIQSASSPDTQKIRSIAAHPGIARTTLFDHLSSGLSAIFMSIVSLFMFQSAEDGTVGLLKAMMDPTAKSGVLYGPADNGSKGPAVPNLPKPYETNEDTKEMLWRTSEEATGVKFAIL